MSLSDEVAALREEMARLRKEIADLRADRTIHHYHHQAAPAPFTTPLYYPNQAPAPSPVAPWVGMCAGGMAPEMT